MAANTYSILYKKSVDKDLRKLPATVRGTIVTKIQKLALNPFPVQSSKLRGASDLYRLRSTDYRIVYQVKNTELIVLVVKIGHRKKVHRDI